MNYIKDYLQRNWINYLVFVATAIASLYLSDFPVEAAQLLKFFPWLLMVLGIVLAVLFNKSKLFFTLLLSLWTLSVLTLRLPENRFYDLLFFMTGLAVPFNALFYTGTRERGVFSAAGKFKLAMLGFQLILIFYLLLFQESWIATLKEWHIVSQNLQRFIVPDDLVALVFFLILLLLIVRDFFKRDSNQSVQFFSLVSVFMALLKPDDVLWYSLFLSGSGLYHLLTLIQKSYTMAYLDDLTGIPGRRALNEDLQKLSGTFAVSMIDIDLFKQFNDTHGHDVGDEALRHVAKTMKRALRGGRIYRYGGEEFTIIFPGKDIAHALVNLEEIRRRVETEPLIVSKRSKSKVSQQKLPLTISLGLAESRQDSRPHEVLKLADTALYRAKDKGRNNVSQ